MWFGGVWRCWAGASGGVRSQRRAARCEEGGTARCFAHLRRPRPSIRPQHLHPCNITPRTSSCHGLCAQGTLGDSEPTAQRSPAGFHEEGGTARCLCTCAALVRTPRPARAGNHTTARVPCAKISRHAKHAASFAHALRHDSACDLRQDFTAEARSSVTEARSAWEPWAVAAGAPAKDPPAPAQLPPLQLLPLHLPRHTFPPHPPRSSPRLAPRGPAAPSYAAQSTFRDSPWEGRSCRAKGRCPAWRKPARPPRAGTEPEPLPQQGA